jgi:hypothetical protein
MSRTSPLCGRSRGPLDLYFILLFLYSSVIPTIPETCCFNPDKLIGFQNDIFQNHYL